MPPQRSSLRAVRWEFLPMRRCRNPSITASVERLLGEGPIKQDETTQVGGRA
jgi:hypothetical protein